MNRSKPLPAFQTTLLLSAALDREGSIRLSHGANVFAIDGPCPLGVLGPPRFAENLWDSRQPWRASRRLAVAASCCEFSRGLIVRQMIHETLAQCRWNALYRRPKHT